MDLEKARAKTYEERVQATKEAIAKLVGADKILKEDELNKKEEQTECTKKNH